MSTKKKPASKPAAAKGPVPLLKLKFEKFPDKPVAVYFEATKRCFYADFGFEQYESPSVAGLEQKIKAAIKAGATPHPVWTPVITISLEGGMNFNSRDTVEADFIVTLKRQYVIVTKDGLRHAPWGSAEKSRKYNRESHIFGYSESRRLKSLPRLPWAHKDKYDPRAVLPYSDQLWEQMSAIVHQLVASRTAIETAIAKADFSKVFIPKAAAAPKSSPAGAGAGSAGKSKPAPTTSKPDPRQPLLPLGADHSESAKKSAAKKGLGKSLSAIRDDVKQGSGSPGLRVAGKSAKTANRARKPSNGDQTKREPLTFKFRGNPLYLGVGHLGNYLVEALRPHYSDIRSGFITRDGRIQLTLGDVTKQRLEYLEPADFEHKINNPPPAQITDQPPTAALGNGAIAKLHELRNQMEPEDGPVQIPSLILMAAGWPEKASGELHGDGEIIIRLPRKAPHFTRLDALEKSILDHDIPADPAEKDLVTA